MHFVRGLVRPASECVLRELERIHDQLHGSPPARRPAGSGPSAPPHTIERFIIRTELIDCYGDRQCIPLILPRRLMQTVASVTAAAHKTDAHHAPRNSSAMDASTMCSMLRQLQTCVTDGGASVSNSVPSCAGIGDTRTEGDETTDSAASTHGIANNRPATASSSFCSVSRGRKASSSVAPMLYIKGDVRHTVSELQSRQRRLLCRVEGQLIARDLSRVQELVQHLLRCHASGVCFCEADVARYNGMIEGLLNADTVTVVPANSAASLAAGDSVLNPTSRSVPDTGSANAAATTLSSVVPLRARQDMAVALAIHTQLPALQLRSAQSLAALVDVYSIPAVHSFLDGFAAKDERVPASETCVTQLARRLCEKIHRHPRAQGRLACSDSHDHHGTDNAGSHAKSSDELDSGDKTGQTSSTTSRRNEVGCLGEPDDAAAAHERGSEWGLKQLRDGLRVCERGNMDPAVVYAHDAHAIQRWCDQFLRSNMSAHERAHTVLSVVLQRQLLPRRVALEALSVWCLSSLERVWMRAAMPPCADQDLHPDRHAGGPPDSAPVCKSGPDITFHRMAMARSVSSVVLKDSRRTLVDGGMLHHYADLLHRGELTVYESSFMAFVESCGECHTAAERPRCLQFTMPMLANTCHVNSTGIEDNANHNNSNNYTNHNSARHASSAGDDGHSRNMLPGSATTHAVHRISGESAATLWERLLALAPESAYWRTLLRHNADGIALYTAPGGDVRVTVALPREHECVASAVAAHTASSSSATWSLPILYEDEDVVVVNKPAGLATSRHALSATEMGHAVTDVVSWMMLRRCRAWQDEQDTHEQHKPLEQHNDEEPRDEDRLLSTVGDARRDTASCNAHRATRTSLPNATCRRVWSFIPSHVPRQGQVHRLDIGTSGCLLMTKNDMATDSLRHQMGTSAAFGHRGKLYLALCVVMEPRLQHVPMHGVLHDASDGKIVTHYRIIEFFGGARVAYVECRIEQGKKHQVRRHLAAAGMPVMGDVEQGGAGCCRPLIARVALHAHSLTFVHPRRDEVMTVCAPLPQDMEQALMVLRQEQQVKQDRRKIGGTQQG